MFRKLNFKVSNKILFVLAIFGIFFSGLAYYFGFLALPGIVDDKIWEMKVLKEGTEQWGMFMKMPFPFTFKVYIYNIKNPDDIMEGAKPVMEELGPFVYKVYKWKSEVKRDEMDGEISYNEYQRYEFDKEASGKYNEDDVVTVMNSPYLTMFYKVQDLQPQMVPMLDQSTTPIFGENDGPFMKVKVSDYMFKGVKICEHGAKDDMLANMACKEVAKKKNNSHLGRFTIKSGLQKKEDAGTLTKYDGKPYTKIWKGGNSICNKIRGVTTIFPTKVNQNMTFDAYSEDICRSMTLAYQRPEVVKGVTGFRFVVKNDTFDYSEEENQCFCTNQTKDASPLTGCMKNGLCDLSTCTAGCNRDCSYFRDDDIADDVKCALTIHKEHTRLSGDGFTAWAVYPLYCKGDTSRYISDCFQDEIDNTINVVDEAEQPPPDEYGYNFPPLPTYQPKAALSSAPSKIYSRCELAKELKDVHRLPEKEISTWVCIAEHESSLNTSALGVGDHGLFQISEQYWCSPNSVGLGCNANCASFRDSDISDDLRCIRTIFNEHTAISGDGFNAWVVYPRYCNGDTSKYVQECFSPNKKVIDNVIDRNDFNDVYRYSTFPTTRKDFTAVKKYFGSTFIPQKESTTEYATFRTSYPVRNNTFQSFTSGPRNSVSASSFGSRNSFPESTYTYRTTTVPPTITTRNSYFPSDITTKRYFNFGSTSRGFFDFGSKKESTTEYAPFRTSPSKYSLSHKNSLGTFTTNPRTGVSASSTLASSRGYPGSTYTFRTTTSSPATTKQKSNSAFDIFRRVFRFGTYYDTASSIQTPTFAKNDVSQSISKGDPYSTPSKADTVDDSTNSSRTGKDLRARPTPYRQRPSRPSRPHTRPTGRPSPSVRPPPRPIFTLWPTSTTKPVSTSVYSTTSAYATTSSTTAPTVTKTTPKPTTAKKEVASTTIGRSRPTRQPDLARSGPVILSFPHLLYADPEHANGVDGLKPNQSDHETFVVLEPLSGFPLKLAQRVQFNIFLRPIDGASKLQNSTILDDKLIGMLNTKLFKTLKTATIIKWFVMISGLGCTVLSLCLYIYKRCP
ncbi:unnamed protein product [Callosobruchus maculatus]|uniref:Sensory neuron membrane protein 2 n=1 Tax=Callosobruchus maculatus TaxID=64391 RepID=A0A653BUA4_CALMS|nr:unnamed protein product [Callosobruchus maculatus]